jgi:hypothetical protein
MVISFYATTNVDFMSTSLDAGVDLISLFLGLVVQLRLVCFARLIFSIQRPVYPGIQLYFHRGSTVTDGRVEADYPDGESSRVES